MRRSLAVLVEVHHVVRAHRRRTESGKASNHPVGDEVLGGLPANAHHAGDLVNMIGAVLTGHIFGDGQTIALVEESDKQLSRAPLSTATAGAARLKERMH